jgi:hypothetical protein
MQVSTSHVASVVQAGLQQARAHTPLVSGASRTSRPLTELSLSKTRGGGTIMAGRTGSQAVENPAWRPEAVGIPSYANTPDTTRVPNSARTSPHDRAHSSTHPTALMSPTRRWMTRSRSTSSPRSASRDGLGPKDDPRGTMEASGGTNRARRKLAGS